MEEVVADSCEQMLTSGDAIERLMELRAADRTVFDKVKNFIRSMAEKVRKVYQGLRPDTVEARYVATMLDAFDQLQQLWVEGVAGAAESFENAEINNSAFGSNQNRYAFREYTEHERENWENSKRIVIFENEKQLRSFVRDASADGSMNKKMYFGAINDELADLIFENTGIFVDGYNCSLGANEIRKIFKDHGDISKEAARGQRQITEDDFVNIPKVIMNPSRIEKSSQLYNGKPAIVFSGDQYGRLRVVAVVSDKRLDLFVQTAYASAKKGNLSTPIGEQAPINTPEANSGTVSENNVSQPGDSVKRSDRKSDAAYLDAVKRGDTETAQRMVDEAAKKAGYSVRMFHGAKKGGGFTVFRAWSYFTQNEAYARRYMNQSNREDGNSLYSVYVNLGKTFDTRKAKDRKLFNQIRMEMGLGEIGERGLPDWTDGYDLSEYIEENELPYDSIVLDEGGDMVNGKPVYRGDSYVVRDSSSVKSAAPVTYDDDGNVIPLSQRFRQEEKDIRYSEREQKPYTYAFFASKPDMVVVNVDSNSKYTRESATAFGKQNALEEGFANEYGGITVTVNDTGKEVIIGRNGLRHGLRRANSGNYNENLIVTAKAGSIIKNSIQMNELNPKYDNVDSSYPLLGIAKNQNGDYFIVETIVDTYTNEAVSMDVLYSMNAKKEPGALNVPQATAKLLPFTGSSVKVTDFLKLVNKYFPDILPEDVLKHFGHDARPEGELGKNALYSNRDNAAKENAKLRADVANLKELVKLQGKVTGGTEGAAAVSEVRKQWDEEDFSSDMMEHGGIFENIFKNFGILL